MISEANKIDKLKKQQAIAKAKEYLSQLADVIHNDSHMESVLEYASLIAADNPGANWDVVEIAVWWHDVGRIYIDKGHPAKSSELARADLSEIGLDKPTVDAICHAIETHGSSNIPTSLEGKILRDADKLDFLTPKRWQLAIDNHESWAIETGIKKIPIIRNRILSLDKSKEIFDELFAELKEYVREIDSPYFANYKKHLLELNVKE